MEYRIYYNPCFEFWGYAGKFFALRSVEKEMGSPIHHDDGMIWVICIDKNDCVGIGGLLPKNNYAELKHAYVIPQARGRGIYHKILEIRLDIIRDMDYNLIRTRCTDMSKRTLERFGFNKVGAVGRYSKMELCL